MEMKKRISLELRNKNPAEVCNVNSNCVNVFSVKDADSSEMTMLKTVEFSEPNL